MLLFSCVIQLFLLSLQDKRKQQPKHTTPLIYNIMIIKHFQGGAIDFCFLRQCNVWRVSPFLQSFSQWPSAFLPAPPPDKETKSRFTTKSETECNYSIMQSDYQAECNRNLALLRAHGYNVEECAMMETEELKEGYENIALPRTRTVDCYQGIWHLYTRRFWSVRIDKQERIGEFCHFKAILNIFAHSDDKVIIRKILTAQRAFFVFRQNVFSCLVVWLRNKISINKNI